MKIKWTPEGKVDRKVRTYGCNQPDFNTLAAALHECVVALKQCARGGEGILDGAKNAAVAHDVLRKLGVEP